ncbi:Crp/Fnr family transcriptional regulator [Erythrobacter sp. LQ02-29]|uniref:Crp/Fnr family transcriptional regulator n=1 Tax=Erythrobacter sp. LQ02-29 TaxID=2920384 RepID=UPI001F4D5255|nr:Crp/Fnr family transcriptional regulator [Erythrobacter sp. LQ02-29]MCP9223748.1 Crp/Fnr family transcriptional regulator [Erythrobacter sp. LQ02-29]
MPDCIHCPVRESAACAVLEEDEREALARSGRNLTAQRGETVFAAGDENTACATLVSGALKVRSVDPEGRERILALIHPAGFVGEMFAPFASHDIVALTESRLCVFGRGAMERAIEDHPALARALLRRSQAALHESRSLLEMTAQGRAEARLAALLLDFAAAASHSPCHGTERFDLPLSRGDIANLLGLTIETVSRKIGAFESEGSIRREGRRGIELLDPAQLAEIAGR